MQGDMTPSRQGVSFRNLATEKIDPVVPASEIVADLIRFEPNLKIEPHAHSVPSLTIVLEGTATLKMECQAARQIGPGDTFFMPANVPIVKLDTSTAPLVFVTIFVRKAGDPAREDKTMTLVYPKATATTDRNGLPCPLQISVRYH
jgi:quercetin dioxygenase-like cupin family protein